MIFMDITLIVLMGFLLVILGYIILFIVYRSMDTSGIVLDDPTDHTGERDEILDKPHCPDCGSYDLKLIDNCDGVPWLKGKISEIDYYQCQRCYRQFNDEDWQMARSYRND